MTDTPRPELDACVEAVIAKRASAPRGTFEVHVSPLIRCQIEDREQERHGLICVVPGGVIGFAVGAEWFEDGSLSGGAFRIVEKSGDGT